jgi:dTDP-4-amino-4,6-dideoxygalactose transaminase
VFHLYTIRTSRRDALAEDLRRHGIGCGVYYPTPVHLQPAYASLGMKAGALPVTEVASREALSLPMYADLTVADAGRVVDTVRRFFK